MNGNKILYTCIFLALLLLISFSASAATEPVNDTENFALAQQIINAGVPCSQLNDTQLSMIGDFFMEQFHPGEQHEYMDAMMGGEGSQSLEYMHIAMAQQFYCNNPQYFQDAAGSKNYTGYQQGYGMMGMMGSYSGNYGPGMMQGYSGQYAQDAQIPSGYNNGYVMSPAFYAVSTIVSLLLILVVIALIILILKKR